MRAGRLDTKVTFQKRTVAQDALGAPTSVWSEHAVAWAEVIDQAGGQEIQANVRHDKFPQTLAIRQTAIRLRFVAGIDKTMRVSYRDRVQQIVAVSVIGRNAALEVIAEDING